MEVLGTCLPYVKRYFQVHQWTASLFMAQITQILLFSGMPLLERSKIAVWEWHFFWKKYEKFGFVSALLKKVFSGAPVNCFSLYGSNKCNCVVFGNLAFGEIKDHSLRTTPFQKKICDQSFRFVSTHIKRYFQEHQLSVFFFMAQITVIVLFLGILLLERSKITIWEQQRFLKKNHGSFGFVSTLSKKVFAGAPVRCFSLYGSNNSDSVVFRSFAFGETKDDSLRTTPFF